MFVRYSKIKSSLQLILNLNDWDGFSCIKKCFYSKASPTDGLSSVSLGTDRQALCYCGRQDWGDKSSHGDTANGDVGKASCCSSVRATGKTLHDFFCKELKPEWMLRRKAQVGYRNISPYELNHCKNLSLGFRLKQTCFLKIFHKSARK